MTDLKIDKKQIVKYLNMEADNPEIEALIKASFERNRRVFGTQGYVFAQWGVNCEPCSLDCEFCSLGESNFSFPAEFSLSPDEAVARLMETDLSAVSDIFIMSTADYPFDHILAIGRKLRALLPASLRLVANVGDFSREEAYALRENGYTGFYHIVRLREGEDTKGDPEVREQTIENGMDSGLELYYCIEPLGPEHKAEEIAQEILRAQELKPAVMAVMRRIAIPGSSLYEKGEISDGELTKIAAVTNMAVLPERAMNVHEPCRDTLRAGINQLYAELGVNPRDTEEETQKGRGFSVSQAWEYLNDNGYHRN
ncbi:MAG: radical SAM protein [Spirochaetales bacterium]|nr:radical SAM protein [Spirochaetales bacterium]